MPFVKYIGQNDAIAQLEGAINASATTIVLKAGHGARLASTFPFLATLRNYDTDGSVLKREIVKVTARTDDTLTVVRHFEACRISDTAGAPSSVSSTFDTDDYISMDITAGLIQDIQDEVTLVRTESLPKAGGALTGLLNEAQGADIASATTTNLATATGNSVKITGTTTITGFGTVQAGTCMKLTFTGILTLTNNATSLILPNAGSNITTASGDSGVFVSLGSGNWKCISYTKANGTALVATTPDLSGYVSKLTTITAGEDLVAGDVLYPSGNDIMERVKCTSFASNSATFTEATATRVTKVFKIDATRTLHMSGGYMGTTLAFSAKIGEINAGETDMTYGSAYTAGGVSTQAFDVCQIDTYKFLIFYYKTTATAGANAVIIDVGSSGTTISAGSVVAINTSSVFAQVACAKLDTGRALVIYQAQSDSKKYVQVLSISGSTITTNTHVEFHAGTGNGPSFSLEYLTTDTLIAVYSADDSDTLAAKIITVSGTVPTVNGNNALDATSARYNISRMAVLSATKVAIMYSESSNTDAFVAILTISGTTITKGSNLTVSTVSGFDYAYANVVALGPTTLLTATYLNSTTIRVHLLFVNGTTVTSTTTVDITVSSLSYQGTWVCKFKPFKYLCVIAEQYTFVTLGNNYSARVGVVQADILDTVSGSMYSRFLPAPIYSGLTAGSVYYIDDNARPTTESSLLSTKLGTAINATTILVE